jgi:hypothetical protein
MRILLCLACLACAGQVAESVPSARPTGTGAWIGTDSARFAFPAEPRLRLDWSVPDSLGYPGSPLYSWEVYWDPEWSARGKVPHALWLVSYWDSTGPDHGTLEEMLNPWPVWVMTECLECDGASIAEEHSTLTAALRGDHLEFAIRGAQGIARIFPVIPDTVRLFRRLGPETQYEEFTVPVRSWGAN